MIIFGLILFCIYAIIFYPVIHSLSDPQQFLVSGNLVNNPDYPKIRARILILCVLLRYISLTIISLGIIYQLIKYGFNF